jgi:hypothetical protein
MVGVQRSDLDPITARQRQALARVEHVVVQIAVTGHPQAARARREPGRLVDQQMLHFLHG